MEKRKQPKRNYGSPQSWPTEVAFEQALLVATARFLFTVEETENMNAEDGSDEPGGEMYFEF
jgi:hypothetical protein